ncbi:MAG: antitermination protein NusB [Gemmatimonadales bacterium]
MSIVRSNYAIGWGTLALLNAGLAQVKGQSGLLWGFLSLLLGPIATLLLVTIYAHPKQ